MGVYNISKKNKQEKEIKFMEVIRMSVTVYSTTTCPWCVKAKDYLKAKGIEYNDVNVSVDPSAAKEMIEKSGQRGVPVLDINGSIVVGFDKPQIDKLLGL